MDLKLIRTDYTEDGVFGKLLTEDGKQIAVTLEHAYDSGNGDGSYTSKIPDGTYTCVRGMHKLHKMQDPFETFEITGIAGHSNILFHVGNYNNDSEGCVLLGQSRATTGAFTMITHSTNTFKAFMDLQRGLNSFTLIVTKE